MKMKIIKSIAVVMIGWLMPLTAISQSVTQNYIVTKTYTSSSTTLDQIQYYDGLGRPIETVQKQFTPGSKDLVSRIEYDAYGREYKQWLPAPHATKSDGTYNGTSPSHYGDSYPYSETVYESSPLDRVKDQYGPGAVWRTASRKVTVEYTTNNTSTAALKCPNYRAIDGSTFTKSIDYANGLLTVTKITDEDNNVSYEFRDKIGRLLLQRRVSGSTLYDTNYVYDDYGNLTFILPPLVSDALTVNQSYSFWNTYFNVNLQESVFSFQHDYRNRMQMHYVAGGPIDTDVFDKADRMVMRQTSAFEIPGGAGGRGWVFNKYDGLGRAVLSGIYTGDDYSANNENLRVYNMRNLYQNVVSKEVPANNANAYYYTWNTFPALANVEVTKVYFYDNYTYATINTGNSGSLGWVAKVGYDLQHSSTQGLLTGTWDKLTDGSGWIKTAYFYDAFGNVVQKRSTHNKGGYDYEYYAYNYNNQMTKKLIEHSAFSQAMITEEYTYVYDAKLRLTTVKYKFNGGTEVNMAEYTYNNLGQVSQKKTGGGKETTAIEYNLRGWLTAQTGQRFTENLYYTSNPKGSTGYYGGNASALTWKDSLAIATIRGYSFQYDALGMLTTANYGEGSALTTNPQRYDELFTYDKHGNIKTLKRRGLLDNNAYGLIDDLNVTEYQGNKIRRITDAAGNQNSSDVMEFKKTFTGNGEEFVYGVGLTADYNRNICMIKYNFMYLPKSVQFRRGNRIEYVYDAGGVKRQTTHKVTYTDKNYPYWSLSEPASGDFDPSQTVTKTYLGNKVYVNGALKYVLTEEGYIDKTGNAYTAHYYLNDRLGNHRVVFDASGKWKQINNYYPSGTSIADYPRQSATLDYQPYKFGGKELDRFDKLNFYDFEARSYDPALMRFTMVDPLGAKYPGISPLAYAKNNPVNRIDPDGKDDIFSNSGFFLRRDDKKTEFIMIETKAKNGTINTSKINEQKLSNRAIESIVGHYNSQLDKSDGKMNGVEIKAVYMDKPNVIMKVKSDNPTTIQVNKRSSDADSGGGRVRKEINTVSNMMNNLVHERKHVNQYLEKGSFNESKMELDAIKTQKIHPTWQGITEEYRNMIKDYEDFHLKQIGLKSQ